MSEEVVWARSDAILRRLGTSDLDEGIRLLRNMLAQREAQA